MQVDDKELFDDAEEVDCDGDEDLLGGLLGGGEGGGEDHDAEGGCGRDLETTAAAAPPCWDIGCCSVRLLEWANSLEKLDGRRGPLEPKSGNCPVESRGDGYLPATKTTGPVVPCRPGGLAASSSRGEKVAAVDVVAPGEGELRPPAADTTTAAAASPSSLPPSTLGANEAEILRRREALPPPGPMPPGIPDAETFPVVLGNEVMVSLGRE